MTATLPDKDAAIPAKAEALDKTLPKMVRLSI